MLCGEAYIPTRWNLDESKALTPEEITKKSYEKMVSAGELREIDVRINSFQTNGFKIYGWLAKDKVNYMG